ncbi:hypothetical protein DSO57_1001585 [Entomophthora muscae]|uniref:Uncharacterized protein n=1 Tax=Entomophthora muscae TaxID=34485 RepID=A0ACC2SAU5_9FUNG|nr:hypothetical protein DSO57_1001585 [Entomophthora muscae]
MSYLLVAALGLNGTSALCALLVPLAYYVIGLRDRSVVERVSIRLQVGIGLVNGIKHIVSCLSLKGDDSVWCNFLGFLSSLLFHVYLCLNVCISVNLHLVVVSNRKPNRRWETCYWTASFVLPIALNFPLTIAGIFGKDRRGTCYIRHGPTTNGLLELVYLSLLPLGIVVYCLLVSAITFKKTEDSLEKMRSLIAITCLYQTTCFLSCIGATIAFMYHFFVGPVSTFLKVWAFWGLSTMGILNLIAFLADPLVFKSLSRLLLPQDKQADPNPVPSSYPISYHQLMHLKDASDPRTVSQGVMLKEFQTFL